MYWNGGDRVGSGNGGLRGMCPTLKLTKYGGAAVIGLVIPPTPLVVPPEAISQDDLPPVVVQAVATPVPLDPSGRLQAPERLPVSGGRLFIGGNRLCRPGFCVGD